jgi:antitoxin component of MazEF toxin-antitoxin module
MQTAHLSSERHLIIPTDILEACHLNAGQELEIEITPQGILLKTPNALLRKTSINDLIGCTGYQGKAKTLEEMDAAIEQGIIAEWGKHDSD